MNRMIRIIFNSAIVVFAAIGIVIDIVKMDTAMVLSAFTTQSNIFCLVTVAVTVFWLVKNKSSEDKRYVLFKGMSLTSILLTFFITALLLKPMSGGAHKMEASVALADTLLHIVVPMMMLMDFIIFEKKGNIMPWHPFAWTIFPLYYVAYTAVYRVFGGVYKMGGGIVAKFPYFFLDYETYGLGTVTLWFILIVIGFIGFSFLIFGFDRILFKLRKRKAQLK